MGLPGLWKTLGVCSSIVYRSDWIKKTCHEHWHSLMIVVMLWWWWWWHSTAVSCLRLRSLLLTCRITQLVTLAASYRFRGVCRKSSRDGSSGIARLLKVRGPTKTPTPYRRRQVARYRRHRGGMGRGPKTNLVHSGAVRTGGNHFEYSAAHVLH